MKPDAKIVQSDFGSQASLKTRQIMWTFPRQTEGIQELVIDSFNDLSQTGQPTPQGFGPTMLFAPLMQRCDQIDEGLAACTDVEAALQQSLCQLGSG